MMHTCSFCLELLDSGGRCHHCNPSPAECQAQADELVHDLASVGEYPASPEEADAKAFERDAICATTITWNNRKATDMSREELLAFIVFLDSEFTRCRVDYKNASSVVPGLQITDTERLDWLEKRLHGVQPTFHCECTASLPVPCHVHDGWSTDNRLDHCASIRGAIDTAIRAEDESLRDAMGVAPGQRDETATPNRDIK